MRKGTTMVALVALMVAIFATAAYAANLIEGNNRNNTLNETSGDDDMFGYKGDDVLKANLFLGVDDVDNAYGGADTDFVYVNDGDSDDFAAGGAGPRDRCIVDDLSEVGNGCERVRVEPPVE